MYNKKILVLVSRNGRKILILLTVIVIVVIIVNAVIFANYNDKLLENKIIIIDPGHGGVDGGTTDYSVFFEKDINLNIAQKLKEELVSENAIVELTRDGDYSLDDRNNSSTSRHKRDLISRVSQFNSGKYDIFISLHVNRSSNKKAIGPIILYSAKIPSTELLAGCMQDSLNEYIKKALGVSVRHNAVRSDYYILVNSNIPGVIVETGFISNPKEKLLLMNEGNQSKLVKYIKYGIKDYLKSIHDINASSREDQFPQDSLPEGEERFPSNTGNDIYVADKQNLSR
ncbi:MAG: N-acetylmuramoyl-L-alanine amidase [Clostridia bacterium]|nr:N-acetylmuramoyl-L-alanine amidase [Clostridia bacterium]